MLSVHPRKVAALVPFRLILIGVLTIGLPAMITLTSHPCQQSSYTQLLYPQNNLNLLHWPKFPCTFTSPLNSQTYFLMITSPSLQPTFNQSLSALAPARALYSTILPLPRCSLTTQQGIYPHPLPQFTYPPHRTSSLSS